MRVLIAGAGVAGLEATLALHELAGDRVAITLLTPSPEFIYRPQTIGEPFALPAASRHAVADLAAEVGAELIPDSFAWVDPQERSAHTSTRRVVPYDALLLALGARPREPFAHAVTIDDRHMDGLLHGLVQDIDQGYVRSVAFVSPARLAYPLPLYEFALMTATRADEMQVDVTLTVVTPETAPLALFGTTASVTLARLLDERGVRVITSARAQVPAAGEIVLDGGRRTLRAERIVAMPELYGPAVRGLASDGEGFIPVDPYARVHGVERIWAAGDATTFVIKHGGIAAQQADVAARSIAALAGAPVEPTRFQPEVRGVLLTGREPLYLAARMLGSGSFTGEISKGPASTPTEKISALYLGPYLDRAAPIG